MKQRFLIHDGDLDNHVYEVTRENLKRYYRYSANAEAGIPMEPISNYGEPLPGIAADEFPWDELDHQLNREYDPLECLEALEQEEKENGK